jgi:cyclin-dependent kinase 7
MANSPLVVPGSGEKPALDKSRLSSTAVSSKGATPEVSQGSNGASSGRDLAEQMNEDEKLKYVKGFHFQHIVL